MVYDGVLFPTGVPSAAILAYFDVQVWANGAGNVRFLILVFSKFWIPFFLISNSYRLKIQGDDTLDSLGEKAKVDKPIRIPGHLDIQ